MKVASDCWGEDSAASGPRQHHMRGFVMPVNSLSYAVQLAVKTERELQQNWPGLAGDCVHVVPSPVRHHRLRLKFFVGRANADVGETDGDVEVVSERRPFRFGVSNTDPNLPDRLFFDIEDDFPIATKRIQVAMKATLESLNTKHGESSEMPCVDRLHLVNFVDTMQGDDFLVTMYFTEGEDDVSEEEWRDAMNRGLLMRLKDNLHGDITVVWRSRKCVLTARTEGATAPDESMGGVAQVVEKALFPGRMLCQVEGSFSNPNGAITRGVNDWMHEMLSSRYNVADARLLELCSGCGNHTVGLADLFTQVLCVEIDPHLVRQAKHNLGINNLTHVQVFCDDMKRLPRILRRVAFPDVKGPTVCLVDPPRRGLPNDLARFLGQLDFVDILVYVACGDGLERNAEALAEGFELRELCLADHFAYTHFIEKIAIFTRRRQPTSIAPDTAPSPSC